jgi:hypothetical protein
MQPVQRNSAHMTMRHVEAIQNNESTEDGHQHISIVRCATMCYCAVAYTTTYVLALHSKTKQSHMLTKHPCNVCCNQFECPKTTYAEPHTHSHASDLAQQLHPHCSVVCLLTLAGNTAMPRVGHRRNAFWQLMHCHDNDNL